MKRNSSAAWQRPKSSLSLIRAYDRLRRPAAARRRLAVCQAVLCLAVLFMPVAAAQETAAQETVVQETAVQKTESVPEEVAEETSQQTTQTTSPAVAAELPASDSPLAPARALSRAFRESAQKALPSVVTVFCRTKDASAANPVLGIIGGERSQKFDSVGSGVIISSDGLILTNHHVVADAAIIEVRLQDGRQFRAEDPKSDPQSDVAIVKINVSEELPAAEIGSSNGLYVGDWVMAIGSPFMIESSVSAGIISGTGRYQTLSRDVKGQFLQTDAAINPGNSGGPLLDLDGRVVGINTAISSRTGGFEGIGFAIPIDRAIWIKQELLEFDTVRRGYAGLRASSVPFELARKLDLPENSGAMVNSVVFDRPAAKAGLLPGDVIVDLAGARVQSNASFAELVQQSPIGQPLPITVIRDGQRVELQLELVADPRN